MLSFVLEVTLFIGSSFYFLLAFKAILKKGKSSSKKTPTP